MPDNGGIVKFLRNDGTLQDVPVVRRIAFYRPTRDLKCRPEPARLIATSAANPLKSKSEETGSGVLRN